MLSNFDHAFLEKIYKSQIVQGNQEIIREIRPLASFAFIFLTILLKVIASQLLNNKIFKRKYA